MGKVIVTVILLSPVFTPIFPMTVPSFSEDNTIDYEGCPGGYWSDIQTGAINLGVGVTLASLGAIMWIGNNSENEYVAENGIWVFGIGLVFTFIGIGYLN